MQANTVVRRTGRRRMPVHLTFDVEVWCGGWDRLDARFPAAFDRYFLGRSRHGDYALPKCLEILRRHELVGVHFVEPLFAARFGVGYLEAITHALLDAGQDVQLHLHPEWTDEIRPAVLADSHRKRQHLTLYTEDEQATLLQVGKSMLEAAKGAPVTAFRAGSYAVNRDSYRALARNGIRVDSSLNAVYDHSAGSIPRVAGAFQPQSIDGVVVFPVTVARDGLGRLRPAQINALGLAEMRELLLRAHSHDVERVVVVSHNFEMLKPDSCEPDWIVVRRFESLCRFLRQHDDLFEVGPFPSAAAYVASPELAVELRTGLLPTVGRVFEQGVRRLRA